MVQHYTWSQATRRISTITYTYIYTFWLTLSIENILPNLIIYTGTLQCDDLLGSGRRKKSSKVPRIEDVVDTTPADQGPGMSNVFYKQLFAKQVCLKKTKNKVNI